MSSKGTKAKVAHHAEQGRDRPTPTRHRTHHGHRQKQARRLWRVKEGKRTVFTSPREFDCKEYMRRHPEPDQRLVPPDKSGQKKR